jgi:hypothetical protein
MEFCRIELCDRITNGAVDYQDLYLSPRARNILIILILMLCVLLSDPESFPRIVGAAA